MSINTETVTAELTALAAAHVDNLVAVPNEHGHTLRWETTGCADDHTNTYSIRFIAADGTQYDAAIHEWWFTGSAQPGPEQRWATFTGLVQSNDFVPQEWTEAMAPAAESKRSWFTKLLGR